ncbi:hypothetical protein [Comamonas suwonensis]|uniref:Lipoprotein n=1 Tax=Comamonas suwonensis TaxID=2606214 RepID=A0A843BG58_9BURK|nr:hypothetical protein [Comamonas suwonensis]MBI1626029.1 hypothetical protein [Comamonas suwonensis]
MKIKKITNKGIAQIAAGAIIASVLAACGGGGGNSSDAGNSGSDGSTQQPAPTATTASGVAAVGAPIAGGTVTLKCASGTSTSATTGADGSWKTSLKSSDYPCVIRVEGGQAGVQALSTPLHSVVAGAGIANITPLTDLMVGILSNNKPNAWFDSANNGDLGSKISAAALASAQDKLKEILASLPGKPVLPDGFNPVTSAFNAQKGDAADDLLEIYVTALASTGLTQTEAAASASAGKPLTQGAFAGSMFTTRNMLTFRAGGALTHGGDYVLSIPDPKRGSFTAKITMNADGNVAQVGQPLRNAISLLSNRFAQYCQSEPYPVHYAYISDDWTPVTDSNELVGKLFREYEYCQDTGITQFHSDGSLTYTPYGPNAQPNSMPGFSKAFSGEGMEDPDEDALVKAKAFKITINGKTTYAYVAVSTSKNSQLDFGAGNYVTMGLSEDLN